MRVLAIDGIGGVIAVLGYVVLVPYSGVAGAIASMLVAHVVRLGLYFWIGKGHAPIAYPMRTILALGLLATAFIVFEPSNQTPLMRLIWSSSSILLLIVAAYLLGQYKMFQKLVSQEG